MLSHQRIHLQVFFRKVSHATETRKHTWVVSDTPKLVGRTNQRVGGSPAIKTPSGDRHATLNPKQSTAKSTAGALSNKRRSILSGNGHFAGKVYFS